MSPIFWGVLPFSVLGIHSLKALGIRSGSLLSGAQCASRDGDVGTMGGGCADLRGPEPRLHLRGPAFHYLLVLKWNRN